MTRRGQAYATDPLGGRLQERLVSELLEYLKSKLPPYMVPSAFVVLESVALTSNGKMDRRALPAPDLEAWGRRQYETPTGEVELLLAEVWQELLRVGQVGRRDNFFELGGHSLLIVQMLERLRRSRLSASVRLVYEHPILADLALALTGDTMVEFVVPPSLIPSRCETVTPEMLTLIALDAEQIDRVVQSVPGGARNVQDIYPLVPLQEGMLFHRLINEKSGDAYVLPTLLSLSSREMLGKLIEALQKVVDRHDVLRTAVLWERLPRPVQVVYRQATLLVEEVALDKDRELTEQLDEWLKPERQSLDLRKAPIMRLTIAPDPRGAGWYALMQLHHLTCDYESRETMLAEAMACVEGRVQELPQPLPYRNHVAQALANVHVSDAEAFFRSKLLGIIESTTPFGLLDVHGDGSRIVEVRQTLEFALAQSVRAQARRLSVSAATLFHAAWALVVSRTSGRDDVVYGTVLLGRLQGSAGSKPILGMFLNTLPLRLTLRDTTTEELVERTQRELVDLLHHEQVPLTLAQRCSGISGSAPLFSALLNFRHGTLSRVPERSLMPLGIQRLASPERTNYPVTLSVEDQGERFVMIMDTDRRIDSHRMLGYMSTALRSLVEGLRTAPHMPALTLSILPESERQQVIQLFNDTGAIYPREKLVHELFEAQVERNPNAVSAAYEGQLLTYTELNDRANQLARLLKARGVGVGEYIPILMPRCLRMLIAQLAVLKSGAVYVPVDPKFPAERVAFIFRDCGARRVITDHGVLEEVEYQSLDWIELEDIAQVVEEFPRTNLTLRMDAHPPAYVMYTSGSTGVPKGVVVPHHAVNRLVINNEYVRIGPTDCIAHCSNPAFDASTFEVWGALLNGARVLIVPQSIVLESARFADLLQEYRVTILWMTISLFAQYTDEIARVFGGLRYLVTGGDVVEPWIVSRVLRNNPPGRLLNAYGPTECTTFSATYRVKTVDENTRSIPIGRPISNTKIYILDGRLQPAPIGVTGEIYIGGDGLAVGYLNRPELTSERFIADPFSGEPKARIYCTGDLGHWRADGNIEFEGRNDQQVKIRGFRIELGEIEAQLLKRSGVKDAVVLAREDEPGEKRLVAYVILRNSAGTEMSPNAEELRAYLRTVLPDHMVPSAILALESFPLTANGKLDQRALPNPEIGAYLSRRLEGPRGKTEEDLASIWQEHLRIEGIGRQDNFFELGGHSLLALRVISKINQFFRSTLRVIDIYGSPTLQELATRIGGSAPTEEVVDLAKEARLTDEIVARSGRPRVPARIVLLTGATGFVGRFLLAQLLQDTDATVYCLVRAGSSQQAKSRIIAVLSKWNLWRAEFEQRIVAISGDLGLPRLGLDESVFQALCEEINSIYHCGTSMNHLESYRMAKRANVEGSLELLRIATKGIPKLINYVSTLDVFGAQGNSTRVVDERTPIELESHLSTQGYSASKWVAEKIFMNAAERGVPLNIFRLGLVWADTECGRYDELQREYRIVKSCLLSGYGIKNYRFEMAATPVDYVSRSVVLLASQHCEGQGIFHISSSSEMSHGLFEVCNEVAGTSLELIPFYDWIREVKRLHDQGRPLPAVPLMEYAFSMDEESFYAQQHRIGSARPRVDCARTHRELELAGVVAPSLSDDLLRIYVRSMISKDADLLNSHCFEYLNQGVAR